MKIRQVAVFLENKCGRLADVAGTLGAAGVNIRAISLADNADFGILRMIVSDTDRAVAALKANGYVAAQTEVVGVEVDDRPGGLEAVLNVLQEHNLNVEYMYAFVNKSPDKAVLIMRFDEPDRAIAALERAAIPVVKADVLATI
ncbi:MAG: ACT domain-containing protein [Chloroflexota bacterium]